MGSQEILSAAGGSRKVNCWYLQSVLYLTGLPFQQEYQRGLGWGKNQFTKIEK